MRVPGTTKINGVGTESAYAADLAEDTVAPGPFSPGQAVSADVTLNADGEVSALTLTTPTVTKTWNESNSTFETALGFMTGAVTDNGEDAIAVADQEALGFEYQTFGSWATGIDTGSGKVGVFSVGAETQVANIPTSGTAEFQGKAAAHYVDENGTLDSMGADATLTADFANREVTFATTNSRLSDNTAAAHLNMTGNMTYSGSNSMSGTVSTTGGMSGTMDGRFYGPGAQEVGGTFTLTGQGNETLAGGYGAARP